MESIESKMSRCLRDFFYVLKHYGKFRFFRRVYGEIIQDNVFTNAAAMAYAWVFAVFPFVICLFTLLPYLPTRFREDAKSSVNQAIAEYLVVSKTNATEKAATQASSQPTTSPADKPGDLISRQFATLVDQPRGGFLSVGLLLTLFAASGGMNTTMSALDQAFDVGRQRSYFFKRFIAMLLTVFMGVSLIIIALMMPIGSLVTGFITNYGDHLPDWLRPYINTPTLFLFTIIRYAIGLSMLQFMIGVIFHYGRSERDRISFFSPGALLTAAGWIISGFGMRYYVDHFANFPKTYGAVAGMVIMLMIFYINAIMILVGAELDSEVKHIRAELDSPFRDDPQISQPVAHH